MDVKRITPEEAKSLLDSGDGYVYLDVRTVEEFNAGHVPGAKNIPFIDRMGPNPHFVEIVEKNFSKDARLICGCQHARRSLMAAQVLKNAGFTNVVDMRGGFEGEMDHCGCLVMPGWALQGLPTSTESTPEDQYESLKSR